MTFPDTPNPRRNLIAARVLTVIGLMLLVVAAIHLVITPVLRRVILVNVLTPEALAIVDGPFLINHVVVGILLIPLGLTMLYSAAGFRSGARWAWTLALLNSTGVFGMPIALILFMRPAQMTAIPFLIAVALVTLTAVGLLALLLWVRFGHPEK